MAYCLETVGLAHAFSRQERVLNNINLQIKEASIYGFLGPNGAGKTTTLRLVLGLLTKQQGTITIFGKSFEQNRVAILQKIGSLIESPKQRISEVLKDVGLAATGHKKTGRFSLGMKQRLAIAIALLNSPSLLILDEPTNGLDPNGIIAIRELLKKLNQEQGSKGAMMFQGTLSELTSKQQQVSSIVMETNDPVRVLQVLQDNNIKASIGNGKIQLPVLSKQAIAGINRQLVQHAIDVYEISILKNDLESIFMDLIK